MSKDKLLSDDELRERVLSTIRWHSSDMITLGKQRKINTTDYHNKQVLSSEEMALNELMPLFNTQKRLYAQQKVDEAYDEWHGNTGL